MPEHSEVAEHYNRIPSFSRRERRASRIINIRNANNFIKAKLIQQYVDEGDAVLDLGCGKGGDLMKLSRRKIGGYRGYDIAEKSVDEAKKRAQRVGFSAHLEALDVYGTELTLDAKVDKVMAQFSFHYAFSDRATLATALGNASRNLKGGGLFFATVPSEEVLLRRLRKYGNNFGNKYYKVSFAGLAPHAEHSSPEEGAAGGARARRLGLGTAYSFSLDEAVVGCREYIVDEEALAEEALKAGLEICASADFLSLLNKYIQEDKSLYDRMVGARLNREELAVIELYKVIVMVRK